MRKVIALISVLTLLSVGLLLGAVEPPALEYPQSPDGSMPDGWSVCPKGTVPREVCNQICWDVPLVGQVCFTTICYVQCAAY